MEEKTEDTMKPKGSAAWKARIIELANNNGGRIEPDQVIADAKDPESPLHGQFEWNIEKASFEHWRATARQLIRSVYVERILHEKTAEVIGYVRDPTKEAKEQGYVSTSLLRDETDLARQALESEFGRAEAALKRAFEVAGVLDLQDDIGILLQNIGLARVKAKKV